MAKVVIEGLMKTPEALADVKSAIRDSVKSYGGKVKRFTPRDLIITVDVDSEEVADKLVATLKQGKDVSVTKVTDALLSYLADNNGLVEARNTAK